MVTQKMEAQPKIAVIILNYNSKKFILKFLDKTKKMMDMQEGIIKL